MAGPLYNRDILRLAASIPHQARLEQAQGSAERRSAVCGSRVVVDVAVDGEGRVTALGQEVNACALGQASAALMGGHAIGRSLEELEAAREALAAFFAGERAEPGDWPGLDVLLVARPYPGRHRSILLPFEAVAEAARLAVMEQAGG